MNVKHALLLAAIVIIVAACSDRDAPTRGFEERTVNVGGLAHRYRVFVPESRNPDVPLPVMLYLHGSGVRGTDNVAQADAFAAAVAGVSEKIDFLVVLPQCENETFWASESMAKYSLTALDATVKEFNGDPDRLYLAGFSLGGYGTWQIAAANPGKFAALMPVAGGVIGSRPIDPTDRAAIIPAAGGILDSEDPYAAMAVAIGATPVWLFHGAKDESVPVDFSRKIVRALEEHGNRNVKYTEYADEGHMIFSRSFAEPGFLEWLKAQRRTN